jgi:plastocyanin
VSQGPHRQSLLLPILLPVGALVVIGAVLFGFSRILLAISHNAATVVACVVAVVILGAASVVAGQRRVGPSAIGSLLGVVTGVALMTGSLAFLIVGPQKEEVEPALVTLVAGPKASTEGFEQTSLTFPADRPVDLEFDNEEQGVEHNVDIYQQDPADSPGQTPLLKGQHVVGPAKISYAVAPMPEGSYFFLCEVHPTTMQGTITASKGGAAPGPTVVAKNLAFDTKELDLPEQTPTAVTLDNEDTGVTHNIQMFTDDTLAESLFDGKDVVGPATETYTVPPLDAGTYYFHCDTHPTMSGSVKVAAGPGGGGSPPASGSPPPPDETPTESSPPPDGGGGTPADASISAANLAFSTAALSFPADTPVKLTFDNQDAGVMHDIGIYQDQAYTQPKFTGELVTGPATVVYDVPPLPAATYYFKCTVHPTMAGTVGVT